MGRVITIPEAALDYAIYGDNSQSVASYLSQQLEHMPQVFNEIGQKIYNTMMTGYQYVTDVMTKYHLIDTLQQNGVAQSVENYILPLTDIQQLQQATPVMQRWIMCQPDLRELYLQQNVDGYSDSYQNVFGKGVGTEDYNYRRVIDGMLIDDGTHYTITHYTEELMPGDRPLDFHEKVAVLHTHDIIKHLINSCEIDFTCNSEEPTFINRTRK